MVGQYGFDPEITRMMDTYDWYILPVVNPDGYEYSRENVSSITKWIHRPLEYERVYLPQSICHFVADTPFHIQGDDISGLYLPGCIYHKNVI